jgi:HEAT repeat protein
MADRDGHPAFKAQDARNRGDIDGLLDMLSSTDIGMRLAAAVHLNDMPDPRAIDLLLRALRSEAKYLRMYAAGALGKIGDTSTSDTIYELGRTDQESVVRCACAEALVAVGDRRSIDLFGNLLNERGIRKRFVERTLVELGGIEALPALEAAAARAGLVQKLRLRKTIRALKRAA